MGAPILSVALDNSLVIDSKSSGSIIIVRSELLGFLEAAKIAFKLLTSSLILVISTVEQLSTFGGRHITGLPSHNLVTSPTIKHRNFTCKILNVSFSHSF